MKYLSLIPSIILFILLLLILTKGKYSHTRTEYSRDSRGKFTRGKETYRYYRIGNSRLCLAIEPIIFLLVILSIAALVIINLN